MENYIGVGRCLICRRATLENSPIDPENLASNALLLQDFLNCFHINVLVSKVHDLSSSCQFCQSCEQFLQEWSNIQTQMAQLTRRAAQLTVTLSALLLSAPHIPVESYEDDAGDTIDNGMEHSKEVKLPILLQQTVDDLRNELQRRYSVKVMVDKIQNPCPLRELNTEGFTPLSLGHCGDEDDEAKDDWRGNDDESDAEYLPSEDQLEDDEDTSEQAFEMRIKTVEEVKSSDDSTEHDSGKLKEIKPNPKSQQTEAKVKRVRTNGVPKKRSRNAIIPDGPNRFIYKGMSFQRNEEDGTYTCDACGFRSLPQRQSIISHILRHIAKLSTNKAKKPKPLKAAVPDGPNKFKYNGHGLHFNDEDGCYYCSACDFKGNSNINSILLHIRELHYTEEDKLKFTGVKISNTEWLYGGKYQIIKMDEKFKCVSCGYSSFILKDLYSHIRNQHVNSEGPDAVPLAVVVDAPSVIDATPTEGVYMSVPYTFNPADNMYTCGMCQSQIASSRVNIRRHIKELHTDEALKVVCEICGKELLNQRSYKSHLKKHQTEPQNCPTCNKQFRDARAFKRHLKIHAFGDAAKKYQCEYCGKKFILPGQCKFHVMTHTGEKPNECKECGEKFRYWSLLAKHRQSVHGAVRKVRNLIRISD